MKAILRHLHMSPRKVRLVASLVRGMDVSRAVLELEHHARHAALPIKKLLQSAAANASNNFQVERENLYIKEVRVDEGPMQKRMRPRAMGRSAAIRRRTSHIILVLGMKDERPIPQKTGKRMAGAGESRIITPDEARGNAMRTSDSARRRERSGTVSAKQPVAPKVRRMFQRKAI